ncbi:MAG: stage III sporulation protein AD [Lachnospiraceae bacterium]|nr:stage III sporulation protein AD [Lachnospiraceae bacterium]
MTMIQAAVTGILAVVLAVQIKTLRPEYSSYLILAVGVLIAGLGASRLDVILETMKTIGSYIHIQNVYLGTLSNMVGIAYIAEFASGICKDAGFSSLGMQVEMFGKLSIMVMSAPVLLALLETLQRFMG